VSAAGALDGRLLRRARAVRVLLAADVALGFAASATAIAQASLLAAIVARCFDGEDVGAHLPVALALAFALRGALGWCAVVAGHRAAGRVISDLRRALVARRLSGHPMAADGVTGGEVVAASVQGVDPLGDYFARCVPQAVLAVIAPVAIIAWVAAALDLESAAVMALTLPLVPLFMVLIGRFTAQRTRERWEALAGLSSRFLDALRGLPTLRALNRAEAQAGVLAAAGEQHRRASMGTLRAAFLSGAVLELAATLGVALVAVTAGVRLTEGRLGLQTALTVLVLAPEVYLPLRRLGAEFHAGADGVAVARRMLDLLDAPVEVAPGGRRVAPSPRHVPVRLERVSFTYPGRPGAVVRDLDLELAPCETLALVGPSGAGKSTVAALVLGLLRPGAGRVTAGGVDLAHCRPEAWHARLAWVPQHPVLPAGSVADAIRLGDRTASDARVREAAMLAGADAFVRALPDGYATAVGDGGRPLSPGQLRRVALARAFLRDAALVVLDEPSADLDPVSVAVLAEAVARLGAHRTLLVIAHRPELIASADRVVALGRPADAAPLERAPW
jgi:thiol reductant ABC exporter CydD subunit